jgi:YHS domain-containing protein
MNESTETATVQIWNKVCPVKGEEVDTEAPTVEYNGKVIGFCCPGCDSKFRKDPEKYMKNLNEDGTKFIGS